MDRVILIYNKKKTNIEKFAAESDPNYTFTLHKRYVT